MNLQKKMRRETPIQVLVHSEKLGLNYNFSTGTVDAPWHVASIGKVFTAVLIQMLADRGRLSLHDPIVRFFSDAELLNLFVYKNTDYAHQVTVGHLLNHTSGIADYFEGAVTRGSSFLREVLARPDFRWTPEKLIEYTRTRQKAVGKPGSVFNYSDTGYILLGQLIEKLTGKPFHVNLHEAFFVPLEMNDSYLMFCSEPENTPKMPIEKIWFDNAEISGYESLSCDWAGGGVVSTTGDLLKFCKALQGGRLIQPATLKVMETCTNKFRSGIYYGQGMMELRFEGFFFLLKGLPRVKGHIGVLSTHMFHDPVNDAFIMMNMGSNRNMEASFRALIDIENTLLRL